MNLYFISQNVNSGLDTYDSAVVAAETPEEAQRIEPAGHGWATSDNVEVELIGKAVEGMTKGVIIASYNAG